MQKLAIILIVVTIVAVVIDCQGIKRQITFTDNKSNESDSKSDEHIEERGYFGPIWGPHFRKTRRPRPARPTRPSPTTTTQAPDPNEIPKHIQDCIDECPRRTTSEYNPVCGTNDQTYDNLNKLNCAVDCGLNVQFRRVGACQPLR